MNKGWILLDHQGEHFRTATAIQYKTEQAFSCQDLPAFFAIDSTENFIFTKVALTSKHHMFVREPKTR